MRGLKHFSPTTPKAWAGTKLDGRTPTHLRDTRASCHHKTKDRRATNVAKRSYTEDQKQEALHLYELEGPTAVQKKLGIPKSTVTKWAKANSVPTVHTSRTREATEARSVGLKARRQELTALLLEDAHKLRKQLWEPTVVFNFGGKDNDYNEHHVDEPSFADKRSILGSVGIAVDRVIKLEAVDQDGGQTTAVSMLDKLAKQLMEVDVGHVAGSVTEAVALPVEE